jgi:hypothetical protein
MELLEPFLDRWRSDPLKLNDRLSKGICWLEGSYITGISKAKTRARSEVWYSDWLCPGSVCLFKGLSDAIILGCNH